MKDIELFRDSFQNFRSYQLPKAQLIIADVPYCYDELTECFTLNGWKQYKDITKEDKVLSLNHNTQEISYSGIENIIIKDNNEDMYSFKSKDIDLFVSAKHRCYAKMKYIPNLKHGERIRNRKRIITDDIKTADCITANCYIPRSGYLWKSDIKTEYITIPSCEVGLNQFHTKFHEEKKINMKHWLRFFGLWLADGSISRCSSSGYVVSIKQFGDNREKVSEILDNLPFKYSEHKEKNRRASNFNIYSKQLYLYLEQFGDSLNKFIPRVILDLPKDYLEVFWESYIFGDSTKNGDGIKISSVSEKLILGLQEVALKLGTICQIRKYYYKDWVNPLYYFQYNPHSKNIGYNKKTKVENYSGKLWCITLKNNSVFLVRRNGIICFSGNCLGNKAYASNPAWYIDGDNKNGESNKAGKQFFNSDSEFRPAEFMHFCSDMLIKEPKKPGQSPCMIIFCEYEQQFMFIELGRKYGLMKYIPLVFRKDFSAQVLKANMKIVGNCEYGLLLYRDKLPKFNNDGRMIFNCFDWVRDNDTPKVHSTQKPVPLLRRLIEIFTDKGDVVIDPCAGSASTLLAAAQLGRRAYGFEIDRKFFNDANKYVLSRIQKTLF